MKFEKYNIADNLKKSLAKMGFKRPTDIQYKAIPHILKGEDVLAIAQTGTGKTAAFVIPTLALLQKKAERIDRPRAVVMAPTHELAQQIAAVFKQVGQFTQLRMLAIYGGVSQDEQIDSLKSGVDVLIATPGRLFDLQAQGHLKLDLVELLILDEADQMLKLGFYEDIQDLLKRLPQKRQTLFFSATIDREIKKLAYSLVNKPIRIQISPKDPVNKNIDHSVCFLEMDDKRFFLERIQKENPEKKILVFVRTKVRAERVSKAMERAGIHALSLHGDKSQKARDAVLSDFRQGNCLMLIATDVSARGIDIPNVDLVIIYDLPELPENYVHRVGRTGRGKRKGKAISFCSSDEKELLTAIEDYMGVNVKVLHVDKEEYEATIDLSDSHLFSFKDVQRALQEEEAAKKNKRKKKKK